MHKPRSLNLGGIIFSVVTIYLMYYLLLRDNMLPFSIHAVLSHINHYCKHWRVLAVGLLPLYVALMFFGATIIGIYIGTQFQQWFIRKK